jgi:hypothetical protein
MEQPSSLQDICIYNIGILDINFTPLPEIIKENIKKRKKVWENMWHDVIEDYINWNIRNYLCYMCNICGRKGRIVSNPETNCYYCNYRKFFNKIRKFYGTDLQKFLTCKTCKIHGNIYKYNYAF